MRRGQTGMSLWSFVLVLALAGSAVYVGLRLWPMYQEYYAVRMAMKSLAGEAGSADLDPDQARAALLRRLDISYAESVVRDDVSFERITDGWRMRVAYEVRRPLFGNLDVIAKFDSSQDMVRRGGGE